MCEMNSERQRKNKEAAEGAENHLARNEGRNVFVITGLGLIFEKDFKRGMYNSIVRTQDQQFS